MRRPNPALWLWHALGGRLPMHYREWALHDATARTWWLRFLIGVLVRAAVPAVLLFVVLASFGGPLWVAFLSVLLGLVVSVYYALTYAPDSVDSRLARYGYPPQTASVIRAERTEGGSAERRRQYEQAWRHDD